MILLVGLALAWQTAADPGQLKTILARVSEEAEIFASLAGNVIGQEKLSHRSLRKPPRFRPRIGASALKPPPLRYQTREVISEYGYSALRDAPEKLLEFRQVLSVDGRQVSRPDQARQVLAMNMRSEDDRKRRAMLENFERLGTAGAASDFGQLILLFRRRLLENYDFHLSRSTRSGAFEVLVLNYRQRRGPDALRLYEGRRLERIPMQGELWVRAEDFLPLRITMSVESKEGDLPVLHEASVDYRASAHGLLLPAAVRYRKRSGELLLVENLYEYSNFRMFSVEAEIKFSPEVKTPQ